MDISAPSILYVPANNEKALSKCLTLDAGAWIIDCEDAVRMDEKKAARESMISFIKANPLSKNNLCIRINSIESSIGYEDIKAMATSRPAAILLPKIRNCDDIHKVRYVLEKYNYLKTELWLMIETPQSIANANALAHISAHTKFPIKAWVLGTNDLKKEMGAKSNELLTYKEIAAKLMAVAKANNLLIFDGVTNDIENEQTIQCDAKLAAELGFHGKTIIHPKHIAPLANAYRYSEAEIANMKELITVFESAKSEGKSIAIHKGQMVEELHANQAKAALKLSQVKL